MSPGAGVSLAVLAHALLLGYWTAKVDLMDFYTLIMERLVWYSHFSFIVYVWFMYVSAQLASEQVVGNRDTFPSSVYKHSFF